MAIGIVAVGAYVPPDVIDNGTIAEWTGASPEWIDTKTGIAQRRYAHSTTPTSALAHAAADNLLRSRPGAVESIGALVLATSTPDQPQPATAAMVQRLLGISSIPAFDINAVCSGFVYAVAVGAGLLTSSACRGPLLVIAADKYSSVLDRTDARSVALFGDGAGAALLDAVPDGFGIRATKLATHGELADLVEVRAGGTRRPVSAATLATGEHLFRMKGHEVRDYAIAVLPDLIRSTLDEAGLTLAQIDRFVLHQANPRLLEAVARKLRVDFSKFPLTATMFGNTGSASLPVTLAYDHATRPIARGEHVVLAAVGGGMTAGAIALTWY